MKGHPAIVEALNDVLTAELTAINQYFVHHKMCENWGYQKLAARARHESIEEMKHADKVIERILYLEGVPNMQRLSPIRIGETPVEQLQCDLALEVEAVTRLNQSIALCREHGDNGTRELLERIVIDEEEGLDWLEAQLGIVEEIGKDNWLAEQIHE